MINIEKFEKPICNYDYFSVDFAGKNIYINKKEYPLGYITNCVLNISQEDMTVLLVAGAEILSLVKEHKLEGFKKEVFSEAKRIILNFIDIIKDFEPFSLMDSFDSKRIINKMFSDKQLDKYESYYQNYKLKNKPVPKQQYQVMRDYETAEGLLSVYSYLALDTENFGTVVLNFFHNAMNNEARNKEELAEIAYEFFNSEEIKMQIELSNPAYGTMDGFDIKPKQSVVPIIRKDKDKFEILRRVYFGRFMDLYVTEFFESLMQGHYSWKCKVCGRYFLKTSAQKQLYCSEINEKYGVPCSNIAKHPEITKEKLPKQKKSDSPYYPLHKRRADTIRKRKSQGKISAEEATEAKRIIDEYFETALIDTEYAKSQYESDMEMDNIMLTVKKSLS